MINSQTVQFKGIFYRWYNPFLTLKKRMNCTKSISTFFLSTQHPYSMIQGKTNSLTSQSCKPLPYDCTSFWASRYYFQHVFCTCEFNDKRWKKQITKKMYKGPSRSIVRIPQTFFIYYTSDWNFLVTWTKLLKHQCQVSISEQTCMCFLTYICKYIFLFHTLFYYKNGDWVFHLMEFCFIKLVKTGKHWSSFAGSLFCCTKLSVKLLSELYNAMWIICYPILLLTKQYYHMKIVWVTLCQYYQWNIHIHFFRHICQKQILQSHHQFHGLASFQ